MAMPTVYLGIGGADLKLEMLVRKPIMSDPAHSTVENRASYLRCIKRSV